MKIHRTREQIFRQMSQDIPEKLEEKSRDYENDDISPRGFIQFPVESDMIKPLTELMNKAIGYEGDKGIYSVTPQYSPSPHLQIWYDLRDFDAETLSHFLENMEENYEGKRSLTLQEKRRGSVNALEGDLRGKPLLHLSSYRGVYDADIPEHLEEFTKYFHTGEKSDYGDKQSYLIDLSEVSPEDLKSYLWHTFSNLAESDNKKLSDNFEGRAGQAPLPEFMASVEYMPPLDENGRSLSRTQVQFAVDRSNYSMAFKEIADLLREERFLDDEPDERLDSKGPKRLDF